jgi:S1-C subfamily serine protease
MPSSRAVPESPTPSVLAALSTALADAAEQAGRSTVAIHARRRIPSTGVVWRSGVVVTASHTVQREESITITLASGETVSATLAGRDAGADVAVLRLPESVASEPVSSAADDALRVGALVLAIGRPGERITASLGAVSTLGGEWRTWQGGRIDRFVRLDIEIYDGFSGGPLVSAMGGVLGINSSGLARGLPLTIPAVTVNRIADEILATGRVRRGYAGVAVQPIRLPERLVREHALPATTGLMLVDVEPGGPADAAGLLIGDVLLTVGEATLRDPMDLLAVLSTPPERLPLEVRVLRAGAPLTLTLTPGERPARAERSA